MNKLLSIAGVIVISVMFASCADMFEQKIPLTGKNSSLDGLLDSKNEISKLAPPEQFYAASYFSSTEIRLTWTGTRGAAYYMVERATAEPVSESAHLIWEDPEDGDYEILDRFVYGVSYVDEILKNAALDAPEYRNKYYYRVTAFNTAKKFEESEPTEPLSAMLFNAPSGLRASGGTSVDYVDLRWEHSPGADLYEIWRSDFPTGGSATSLGTVRGNQNWFQNRVSVAEQGKDFFYMVTAQNRFGNKTPLTRPAYGYAKVFGAPDAPANVRLDDNSGRGHSKTEIKIKWDAVDEPEAYYAVYRYSSADSSLTRLTDKTSPGVTSWTDSQGLKTGIYYYYKIQAIIYDDAQGKELKSEFSSPDPEGFVISPPDTVVAEKSADGESVIVKWLPAMGHENERLQYRYNVYADNSIDGSFSNCVASEIVPSTNAEGYISAAGLPVNSTFFRVATVKGAIESVLSVTVSPAPAAAIIVDATQHEFISANTTANSSGVYPVKITWKKPANEHPAFYHVQRSTRTGSGFSRINEEPLSADGFHTDVFSYDAVTGTYTYIDKNETARVGRKYYYRVLSLNQLEQGNFPSDEKIGWGALTHTQYLLEYNKTMGAALKKLTYMHKPGSTEKLGTETKNGSIGGTIYYNAAISGLGARIIIQLTNYADFYIENDSANGVYFTLNGNSNTTANMSSNGDMDGTVTCTGMYPGKVWYDNINIKGGAAGGGTYGVQPDGFQRAEVPYTVLE